MFKESGRLKVRIKVLRRNKEKLYQTNSVWKGRARKNGAVFKERSSAPVNPNGQGCTEENGAGVKASRSVLAKPNDQGRTGKLKGGSGKCRAESEFFARVLQLWRRIQAKWSSSANQPCGRPQR
jgi:hypothetical protein